MHGSVGVHSRESLRLSAPERALLSFVEAINAGELDAAASHFAKDAYLLTPDATAIHGRDGIRSILAQLIARRTQIQVQLGHMLTVGAVALSSGRWTLRSAGVEESVFAQASKPTVVLHRIEGDWKLAIAAPWGG
jgi:ketosteroid isomerase-like protein